MKLPKDSDCLCIAVDKVSTYEAISSPATSPWKLRFEARRLSKLVEDLKSVYILSNSFNPWSKLASGKKNLNPI